MRIESFSTSLTAGEVVSLVNAIPYPKGVSVSDVALTDTGIEATIKASLLLGLPIRFRAEVDHVDGPKVFFRVAPPLRLDSLFLEAAAQSNSGARFSGSSISEVDLVSISKGYVTSISVKSLRIGRGGLQVEVASLVSTLSWPQLIQKIAPGKDARRPQV